MRVDYRKVAMILLAVTLLGALLAACGGGDNDDEATATATAATTAATTGSPSAQGTPTRAATLTGSPSAQATPTGPPGALAPTSTPSSSQPTPAFTGTPTVVGPGDATAQTTPLITSRSEFAYGYNVFWRGDDQAQAFNDQTIQAVQESGFEWVRIQLYWNQIQRAPQDEWWDPLPIDILVEQYAASGIKILATVSNPPKWALDPTGNQLLADFSTFGYFMTFMADRYQGKIQAWELWNEPNHAITVNGKIQVSDFAQLMDTGYRAVKSADPHALVVFGGLTPTGVNDPAIAIDDLEYLRSFYELDGGRYRNTFDILGAHGNATNNAPDLMYPDNPGTGGWSQDSSFYFRRLELLHAVMEEYGDNRPIWVTEFGWTTENQAPGYEYGADVSEEDQAEYLVRAFEICRDEWTWCTGMFVWNLNYSTASPPEDEKYPWAVLNGDWSPRPAYTALKEMPKD